MLEAEIALIRHAPAQDGGRLAGRRDVPCDAVPEAAAAALRAAVSGRVLCSPARRCAETARAIWGAAEADVRLWEQDFGAWEGRPYAELPDIGPRPAADLAAFRPPGGESFEDLFARTAPVFTALSGRHVVVAHAGTVRAALALATGHVPAGLAFQVAPLSLTRIVRSSGGWSVIDVNRSLT